MSDPQPAGDICDALGVALTREPDDLPTDAMVLLKVSTPSGTIVRVGWSEGMDWLTRLGLLHAALTMDERESLWTDKNDR